MRRIFILRVLILISIGIFIMGVNMVSCQKQKRGTVLENRNFYSELMQKYINYSVYLPAGYGQTRKTYPVLYLLHGIAGNEINWIQFGEIDYIADDLIASKEIIPMIIIMPDGGKSFYVNDYQGTNPYGDMFIKELIPEVEDKFMVRSGREFRAIAGASMGGYGAVVLSMRNPDIFRTCVSLAGGFMTEEEYEAIPEDSYVENLEWIFGRNEYSGSRITDHWKNYNPFYLVNRSPKAISKVRFYFDCGDDDFLYEGNAMLYVLMRKKNIPIEYRVRDGKHGWEYWRSGARDWLKFISDGFTRTR